jgi:ABC-type sugar transport system permease subunit
MEFVENSAGVPLCILQHAGIDQELYEAAKVDGAEDFV